MIRIAIIEDDAELSVGLNYILSSVKDFSCKIFEDAESAFRQMMPGSPVESPLSEREQEVLNLLAMGLSNMEVADKMNISKATVKAHIYNTYQKLHVSSRIEAINKYKNQQGSF